jgi:hypothetical protein
MNGILKCLNYKTQQYELFWHHQQKIIYHLVNNTTNTFCNQEFYQNYPVVVAHTWNPCTQRADARDHPGLHT